jgi:hypothetical protein
MKTEQVRTLLRAACDEAGSIRKWASRHGVSAMYVSNVLRGKQEPGPAICKPLGLIRTVTYRRK